MRDRDLAVSKLKLPKPENLSERWKEGRKERRKERQTDGKKENICPVLLRNCQTGSKMISVFLTRTFLVWSL